MARTSAQVKGDALEDAVRMIETVILGADPNAKDSPIKIERKKVVIVQGVKHEIDIYIAINNARGYNSTYIFECKNWRTKIDKDKIIAFAQKVRDVRASTGFFIAKRFTKYAVAQAKRDGIELLIADDKLEETLPFLNDFSIWGNNIIGTDSTYKFLVITQEEQNEGYLPGYNSESFVRYKEEGLQLGSLVQRFQHQIVNDYMNQFPKSASKSEKQRFEQSKTFIFPPGELSIEGLECREMQLRVVWESKLIYPTFVSNFDIKTRSRVRTYATDESPLGAAFRFLLSQPMFRKFIACRRTHMNLTKKQVRWIKLYVCTFEKEVARKDTTWYQEETWGAKNRGDERLSS